MGKPATDSQAGGKPTAEELDAKLRRPGQVQLFGRVMARIAGPALKKRGLTRAELLVDWPRIVGPYFAAHTAPLKLVYRRGRGDGGVLHLAVAPALATAVQHEAPRLVERINAYVGHGAIGQLRLSGGLPAAPAPRALRAPPVAMAPSPAVAALDEGPLRDALHRLERHMARAQPDAGSAPDHATLI